MPFEETTEKLSIPSSRQPHDTSFHIQSVSELSSCGVVQKERFHFGATDP